MEVKSINKHVSFRSGLNYTLLKESHNISIKEIESFNLKTRKINIDFCNCNPIAFCLQKVFKIFDILKQKTGKKIFDINIPNIQVYTPPELFFEHTGYGFCIPETQKVIINTPPYNTGSVFYKKEDSLEQINKETEDSFNNGNRSSSHFLANTIHEIMHSSYLNMIYNKYGYNGNCSYTKEKYPLINKNKSGLDVLKLLQILTLSQHENNIIQNVLGTYSIGIQNQYHEIFSETFTQLICKSLSEKNALPIKNPLEDLNRYPKEFLNILFKILSI